MLSLAVITDSTKTHTGFSVVARGVLSYLHGTGRYGINHYGLLDSVPDSRGEVPWVFTPTPFMDDLGHQTYSTFIRAVKPDVVLIIQPPSNVYRYRAIKDESCAYKGKNPKVVIYTPIEGSPMTRDGIEGLEFADKVVAYCENGKEIINSFTGVCAEVAYHGIDHEQWFRYKDEVRHKMKSLVGFDKFIIGSVGVNKRTKGFPEILQVAAELKRRGRKDILFYLHTNADKQTMMGYDLRYLAKYYDIEDMVQWRVVFDDMSYWRGHEASNDTYEYIKNGDFPKPETAEERGMLFASFDLRAVYNVMDLYLDLSQVEGWGLPMHEAMACGVPALTLNDYAVRSEVFKGGPEFIEPIDQRIWPTLHTGAKLVTVDPYVVANHIEALLDDRQRLAQLGDRCHDVAWKYKWADCGAVIDRAIMATQD